MVVEDQYRATVLDTEYDMEINRYGIMPKNFHQENGTRFEI